LAGQNMDIIIAKTKARLNDTNNMKTKVNFLRYPGGKHRKIKYILPYLPRHDEIKGYFIEPFVGGGAVFFALNPKKAFLSDINQDLIDLYLGIKQFPKKIWEIFKSFPSDRDSYYNIRDMKIKNRTLAFHAARLLYLNRTCFKGMWRHDAKGKFNVGYGGQDRRWIINLNNLMKVSELLNNIPLVCSDFEPIIRSAEKNDFIFLDPPYKPGKSELINLHYTYNQFTYKDHRRLAKVLKSSTNKGVRWAMTISSHPEIIKLYDDNKIISIPIGEMKRLEILKKNSGEVLICNYNFSSKL
jgi:DNA adenine methylase